MNFSSEKNNYFFDLKLVSVDFLEEKFHTLNLQPLMSSEEVDEMLSYDITTSSLAVPIINKSNDKIIDVYVVVGTNDYMDCTSLCNGLRKVQTIVLDFINCQKNDNLIISYNQNDLNKISNSYLQQKDITKQLLHLLFKIDNNIMLIEREGED